MSYQQGILYVDLRTAVGLRFVESMTFPDGEDLLADVLKGDLHIDVVTISGKEYSVSMKFIESTDSNLKNVPVERLRTDIYNKWKHLIGSGQ
jgi:hypothetical protein